MTNMVRLGRMGWKSLWTDSIEHRFVVLIKTCVHQAVIRKKMCTPTSNKKKHVYTKPTTAVSSTRSMPTDEVPVAVDAPG